MFFAFQSPEPFHLGPFGILIYTAALIILAVITWRQRSIELKTREKLDTWKSTADAAVAEMHVHKEAAERLRHENRDLQNQTARLEAATDLKPLLNVVQSQGEIIRKWVEEGRKRFDDARDALVVNSNALTALIEEFKSHRTIIDDSHKGLTAAFIAHTLDDKQSQLEHASTQLRIANTLADLEDRLSQVAVRVGVVKWAEKREAAAERAAHREAESSRA